MTSDDDPVGAMQEFGADPVSYRASERGGNMAHDIWVTGSPGMQNDSPHAPESDGRRRRIPLLILWFGHEVLAGYAYFRGDGFLEYTDFGALRDAMYKRNLLPRDDRLTAFVERYVRNIPNLAAVDFQRQWPTQFPSIPGISLRPGMAEVV